MNIGRQSSLTFPFCQTCKWCREAWASRRVHAVDTGGRPWRQGPDPSHPVDKSPDTFAIISTCTDAGGPFACSGRFAHSFGNTRTSAIRQSLPDDMGCQRGLAAG
jgi:hypothetical protein